MALKKIEVQVCDNPSCGKEVLPIDGIHYGFSGGPISYADGAGGFGTAKWFACQFDCLAEAVHARVFGAVRE